MTTGDELYQWMREQGFRGGSRVCRWCGYSGGMRVFSGGQILPPNVELGMGVALVCDFCDIPAPLATQDLDPISRLMWQHLDAIESSAGKWDQRVRAAEHEAGWHSSINCRCVMPQVEPPEIDR